MGILPIFLFILGVIFLFLGWRWQSPSNEEAMTALKGLAYLKSEILRVQDQVHVLEDKIDRAKQIELKEVERRETECKEKCKLYSLNLKDQRENNGRVEIMHLGEEPVNQSSTDSMPQPQPELSPKYQEVLELAENGQLIPEISQRLRLSQDAVRMVLRTHQKGENR